MAAGPALALYPTPLGSDASGAVCAYNGVTFSPVMRSKVTSRPVYDDADRMVKYWEITFDIKAWITNKSGGASIDATVQQLRQQLADPGKEFEYSGIGWGAPFKVNFAGGGQVQDCCWGPKPRELSFSALGGAAAAEIHLLIVCCVPECADNVSTLALMALTYEWRADLDQHGFAVLTTTGSYEIPLTFPDGANALPDNADNWWTSVVQVQPVGYERTTSRTLSADRRRMNFTVTDKELPWPLPMGVTAISMKHEVKEEKNLRTWRNTFRGSVRMNPAFNKSDAWNRFAILVSSRLGHTFSRGRKPIRWSFSWAEDIFGCESSFTVSYVFTGSTIDQILADSGLWRPVSFTWPEWHTSLAGNAQAKKGNRSAAYTNSNDIFINLCGRAVPDVNAMVADVGDPEIEQDDGGDEDVNPGELLQNGNAGGAAAAPAPAPAAALPASAANGTSAAGTSAGSGGSGGGGAGAAAAAAAAASGDTGFASDSGPTHVLADPGEEVTFPSGAVVQAGFSWLHYDVAVRVEVDDGVIRHSPLAGTTTYSDPTVDALGTADTLAIATGSAKLRVQQDTPDIFQQLRAPSAVLVLTGRAMRMGFEIPTPELLSVGGQPVVRLSSSVMPRMAGTFNDIPVYGLDFTITYGIAKVPDVAPIAADPMELIDGTGA